METMGEERSGRTRVDLPILPSLCTAVSFQPSLRLLHQQRKETAALRNLFYSRATTPEDRDREQVYKLRLPDKDHNATTTTRTDEPKLYRNKPSHPASPKPIRRSFDSQSATENPREKHTTYRHFLPNLAASPNYPNSRDQLSSSAKMTSPTPKKRVTSSLRRDVTSPVPYHTSITKRSVGARRPSFRALTQLCSRPLPSPQWMEGLARAYTPQPASSRDLRAWQNEIVKVVPSRPNFVLPLPMKSEGRPKVQGHRYPYKVLSLHPASHFYRSWSKITDKEYDIHPEWASEKHTKSGRPSRTV